MSMSTVYNHSRVCYFGLAKPVWSSGILQGDRQVKGTSRNETGCPSLRPQPTSQCTQTDRRHSICGKLASWFYYALEIKISACLFFGGRREPHQFPQRGFSGKERVHQSCAKASRFLATHRATPLDLVCLSGEGGMASAS